MKFAIFFIALVTGGALHWIGYSAESEELIYDSVVTHKMSLADDEVLLGTTAEGPGLWISKSPKPGVQMGVHGNGFPMLIVTDGAVKNFGLGRMDGKNATPIMVFRSQDIVKMVIGLDMVHPGKEPFLVHYSSDGTKKLFIGEYCDNPSRACTN